jgi:hypothetical protein
MSYALCLMTQAQLATALARQQRLEESLECFAAAQHAHAAYAGISRVLSQQRSSREKSLTPYALCLTNACLRSSAALVKRVLRLMPYALPMRAFAAAQHAEAALLEVRTAMTLRVGVIGIRHKA